MAPPVETRGAVAVTPFTVPVPTLSAWQVTVPSPAMARMLEPAAHDALTRRCRNVVSAAIVPLDVMVPPVRPVPATRLVTVPVPPARVHVPMRPVAASMHIDVAL